jgi:hypothetical protein
MKFNLEYQKLLEMRAAKIQKLESDLRDSVSSAPARYILHPLKTNCVATSYLLAKFGTPMYQPGLVRVSLVRFREMATVDKRTAMLHIPPSEARRYSTPPFPSKLGKTPIRANPLSFGTYVILD